ncbi:MAG: hypothetical protein KGH79_01445 [Patescibacteria group bacterium]|nr:hypothetical protein [Patescibacteria group bacterium]
MDPQVQASFIPKKPLDTGVRSRGAGFGLLFLISLLVFIASIVAAGSVFLYQQYLTKAIADKSHSLTLAEGAFDPSVIEDLLRLDSRINNANSLLSKHVAPSALFDFLSQQTLQNVSFSSFGYSLQNDGSATLTLTGEADSFSTVALQSDQFGASQTLKNVVFSNISVGQTGKITFSVSAVVVPALLRYSGSLSGAANITQPASASQATTTP